MRLSYCYINGVRGPRGRLFWCSDLQSRDNVGMVERVHSSLVHSESAGSEPFLIEGLGEFPVTKWPSRGLYLSSSNRLKLCFHHQLQKNTCLKVAKMASADIHNVNLDSDIDFIQTPAPEPSAFGTTESCGVPLTDVSLSINSNCLISC
jgi:hypothetical protein